MRRALFLIALLSLSWAVAAEEATPQGGTPQAGTPQAGTPQVGTPFVSPVPTNLKSLGGNTLDPLGIWKETDVDLPEASKGLAAGPSVHALSIPVADGTLILSQLWDISCTNSECPTQIILLKKDGTRQVKLEPTMLPQINPADSAAATKGLGGVPSIFLTPDGKSITATSEDHGTEEIPLQ
jgi:hypothetical protein